MIDSFGPYWTKILSRSKVRLSYTFRTLKMLLKGIYLRVEVIDGIVK